MTASRYGTISDLPIAPSRTRLASPVHMPDCIYHIPVFLKDCILSVGARRHATIFQMHLYMPPHSPARQSTEDSSRHFDPLHKYHHKKAGPDNLIRLHPWH